jgi:hypothetical protein
MITFITLTLTYLTLSYDNVDAKTLSRRRVNRVHSTSKKITRDYRRR